MVKIFELSRSLFPAKIIELFKKIDKESLKESQFPVKNHVTIFRSGFFLVIFQVIRRVIECGGLPPVVMMLHSRHGVMLNEALTALTVMAAVMISTKDEEGFSYKDQVVRQLHTDAVINGVKTALKSATVPVEIKSNCLVFVRNLLMVNTDSFKEMLASMHFKSECLNEEALKSLPPEFASLAEEL